MSNTCQPDKAIKTAIKIVDTFISLRVVIFEVGIGVSQYVEDLKFVGGADFFSLRWG